MSMYSTTEFPQMNPAQYGVFPYGAQLMPMAYDHHPAMPMSSTVARQPQTFISNRGVPAPVPAIGTPAGPPAGPPARSRKQQESVGSMLFADGGVAHYAILEHTDGQTEQWGQLMQSIAVDLWRLKEPKVLISVTGGAEDFAMSRVDNEQLMQGLMQVAIETSVWFVTGGTEAGIMKLVGDARKQYAADAPLIGVASWDVLTGKEEIDKHKPGDELLPYQPLFGSAAAEQNKPVKLDSGHSHFFLIKGVKQDFGGEIDSRSAFEKRVGLGRDIAVPQNQLNRITNYNEWKDARDDGPRLPDSVNSEVPVVCVCVQGGPGTVSTVLGAVTNGTPALLVRGSGKAADLIADMILLRQNDDTAVSLSPRQDRLGKFLFTENQTQGKASGEKGVKSFRQDVPKIVQELKDLGWGNEKHPHPVKVQEGTPSADLAWILEQYWGARNQNVFVAFEDAMKAAQNPLCEVFELGGEVPFSDSLLECIVHGIDGSRGNDPPPGSGKPSRLERKLTLAVEFNNLAILKKQVQNRKTANDETAEQLAMDRALDTALCKQNRPDLVDYLVNNGAKVDGYNLKGVKSDKRAEAENRWKQLARTVPGNILKDQRLKKLLDPPPPNVAGGTDPAVVQREKSFRKSSTADKDWLEEFQFCFEQRVKEIVGAGFDYKMSAITPEFDLMILAAMRNDRDLAVVWWKEYKYPVRAALTIAMLYRNLAQTPDTIPHEKIKMRESAEFFEAIATQVQDYSIDQDYFLGISNLEIPLKIWNGNTLVDVAYRSESDTFLTTCCTEAIDRRFAGDLRVYDQNLLRLGWIKGLKANVLVNLCCLGLFAPKLIAFEPFPVSDNLRYPTQRIRVPKTFRNKAGRTHLYGNDVTPERGPMANMIDTAMQEDQDKNSAMYNWWEKFALFWQAPITLFLAGAMQKTFIVIAFTWWLFTTPDSKREEPFYFSKEISPEFDGGLKFGWPIWPFEVGLCVLFGSSVISELVQFFILGSSYLFDFWNILDATAIGFFFAGFGMRYACSNGSGLGMRDWCENPPHWDQVESVRVDGMWVYMYSISLFLLWVRMLRILSVSKRLGPFVILVVQMGRDISMFAVVYAIFLAAFSVLIRGSMPYSYDECNGGPDDPEPYKCWTMWWVLRTFIQASGGEIYVDDMKTDAAMIGLILLWIVMNLLLLNLVIAIMSSTYESVKEKSEKIFLRDLYEITNEFARRSAAAPWPVNVVLILFDIGYFVSRTVMIDKIWPSQTLNRKFDLFMRRNISLDKKQQTEIHTKAVESGETLGADDVKRAKEAHRKPVMRDMEVEYFWGLKMTAFTERARNKFLEDEQWMDLRKQWKLRFAEKDANEESKDLVARVNLLLNEQEKEKIKKKEAVEPSSNRPQQMSRAGARFDPASNYYQDPYMQSPPSHSYPNWGGYPLA